MSEIEQISNRVAGISEQIATDYMNKEDVKEVIQSEDAKLYLHTDEKISSYQNFQEVDVKDINGYLIVRVYKDFQHFSDRVDYEQYIVQSKYDESEMFPITVLESMSVKAERQGDGIGTTMASQAMSVASKNDNYPVIARMWKKSGKNNGHIKTAKSYLDGTKVGEDEEFLQNMKCQICKEYDCDCSEVYMVFNS